jgi:ADP-ribose pyrophosphatase YjhB (NUDIX family)
MPSDQNSSQDAKEFLLKEYDSLSESIWKNEATGETRVNWFLGIVTVGIGGILKVLSADKRPHAAALHLITIACLAGLLAFGLVTLCRVFRRNKRTDLMIADLDSIRQIFRDRYDPTEVLRGHYPFGRASSRKPPKRKFGGLADLILTINSLLVGGLAFVMAYAWRPATLGSWLYPFCSAVAIVSAVVAFCLQYYVIHVRDEDGFSHAGGVIYRLEDDQPRYLLVRPSRENIATEWVLPKGHIKKDAGETAPAAALREVEEETGNTARILAPLGSVFFVADKGTVRTIFYLMEKLPRAGTKTDAREVEWFSFEDACRNATHSGTRRMLCLGEATRLEGS